MSKLPTTDRRTDTGAVSVLDGLPAAPTTIAAEPTTIAAEPTTIAALWRSLLPSTHEIRVARRRLHGKAVVTAVLLAVSYWALVLSSFPVVLRIGAAGVLVAALITVATGVMHDANHGSFSRHRWINRLLATTSDALGASSWLWRNQHNSLHHGNPNVDGFDADIALAPFARLAPDQPWQRWHRAQHIYMWPLYGFLALKNLLVSDVMTLVRRRIGTQPLREPVGWWLVVRIALGKAVHVGWAVVVPLMFNPWWAVLAFYLSCSWLVGFFLAMTFQLAHCVDTVEFLPASASRRGESFYVHQLNTTSNIASATPGVGHLFRWLVGGLDHQIEHHLAPRLPHTIYPRIAKRFRQVCAAHRIPYREHRSPWAAVCAHARWLRAMSQPGHQAPAGSASA